MANIDKRHLTFSIDGDEYYDAVSNFEIDTKASDADFKPFKLSAEGGATSYTLKMTFAQDMAATSLWTLMETKAGQDVDVVFRPYGNAVPSVSQPHLEFTVTVTRPDGAWLGGESDSSTTAVNTCEVEWVATAAPVKVTSV